MAVGNTLGASVTIALGNGDGTFVSSNEYNTDLNLEGTAVGDFNKDGNLDLVTASLNTNKATVLLGNANGTFNAAVGYTVGTHPHDVAVADLNNDGKLDLATPNYDGTSLSVLLGNGNGTFQTATHIPLTGSLFRPFNLTAGDLNADGKLDLITTNNGIGRINVLLNSPSVRGVNFNAVVTLPATGVLVATLADFDTAKTAASFTATINWGDGTPASAGTVAADGSGGFNITGTHTYAAPGLYTVGVQVADTAGNFAKATDKVTVLKRDQTITFGTLSNKAFGNADFTVSTTASSGLAVSFAAGGACTVSGTTVHLTGAGSCTVTAS